MAAPYLWNLQPEVFSFSPLPRWYSLLFASGIVGGYAIIRKMFIREGKPVELLDSLLVYIVVGMMVGMRLGHVIFYQPDYYINHLLEIPMIWKGGYASHGGFLGVIIALVLFVRKNRDITFLWLADRVAIISLFAAGCIRLGNFCNSEIIGRPAAESLPWAVIFTQVDQVPRHPAQLYEAIGYFGLCGLSLLLYYRTRLAEQTGRLMGLIIATGFAWRFFCEFFKEDQVPFEAGLTLNMGQMLSIPFIIGATALALNVQGRWQTAAAASESPKLQTPVRKRRRQKA
jgi:prolipoprotein diacylglyceryl transferase